MGLHMTETAVPTLSIGEQLLHSTIRLECEDAEGNKSSGTGFNFSFEIDGMYVPVIITNRHVFADAIICQFYYTLADDAGKSLGKHEQFSITEFNKSWIGHPDPSVDLALFPIQPLIALMESAGKRPFYINLGEGIVATEELLASLEPIEDVTMIGYPNGLWDNVNNLPIVRRGITATSAAKRYRGQREFLIDAACFPGSSGSPVFIFNNGSFSGGGGIHVGTRLLMIGVLFAGHMHTAVGEIKVIPIPTSMAPVPVSQVPNNLGICISATRILEFAPALKARIDSGKSESGS
jgi:hypothetical protein